MGFWALGLCSRRLRVFYQGQERYEIYQEASVLMQQTRPVFWKWEDRQIELREVKDLPFIDPAIGPMRVVQAKEQWSERRQQGGRKALVA